MMRLEFAGGWYADALPGGEYVVSYGGRGYMDTHRGPVDFPSPERFPYFVRCTMVGGAFKVAGQHGTNDTPEWVEGIGWRSVPATACGVSPVIYDAAGVLHISDCSIGTQGWRYVEQGTGRLVTGDQTYAPVAPSELFEWTDLGDGLIIGQGPGAGVSVWDGTHHRRLADGICRFIRAHRDGDRVSVAYWREDGPSAAHWLTVAELRALPIVTAPPQPTEPAPVVPEFAATDQRIGIGVFDDAEGPRIMDYTEAWSENVRAFYYDTRWPAADLDESLDLAADKGWPVEVYHDLKHGLDPEDVPDEARALVYAYPAADESVEQSLAFVRASLELCAKEDVPVDLCCAGYCQYRGPGDYALSQQKVLDMLAGVWNLALEFRAGALWIFTKYRDAEIDGINQVVDGLDYWPALGDAVERMKRASADWLHFPPLEREPEPPDKPEPPEPERPEPPEPETPEPPRLFYPIGELDL